MKSVVPPLDTPPIPVRSGLQETLHLIGPLLGMYSRPSPMTQEQQRLVDSDCGVTLSSGDV